jgi:hypothetical protein
MTKVYRSRRRRRRDRAGIVRLDRSDARGFQEMVGKQFDAG